MDRKGKQVPGSSSSSSSFTADLFGPKDSSKSSTGYFDSIFGPPYKGAPVRDTTRPDSEHSYNAKHDTTTDTYNNRKGKSMKNESKPSYENERSVEPCYYNSSIHYGGQENYTYASQHISPPHNFKKDGENDENEGASRGNWWKVDHSIIKELASLNFTLSVKSTTKKKENGAKNYIYKY
ncbi:hypothetical protein CASFOL_006602 [Castilleja foliolosa]|uniref:Uncharacterized protein n=1 Tax=Castilleja foliolosa TaxID=1961234 RepID=A0ABD3EAP8_9LAMI